MKTVLIVDDEADILEVLQNILTDEGYRVVTACNGQECLGRLQAAGAHLPDLVLLDLMMPVLDGCGVIEAMRADSRWRAIPLIMMSAGDARGIARAFGLELIRKPFGLKVLLDRLKVILDRP